MVLLCLCLYLSSVHPFGPKPSAATCPLDTRAKVSRWASLAFQPLRPSGPKGVQVHRTLGPVGASAGRPLWDCTAGTPDPFDNVLLDLKRSKQKIIWMNCLIAFSGGQDSINLVILWKNLLDEDGASYGGLGWEDPHSLALKNQPSIIWCNHIWKIPDFYLFRHSFQISFLFNQRLFYTIFFSKYFSEKKARKWRYFSFLRVARYSGYESVLTAHTQSDSIETFFINLFRGSGQFGLQTLRNLQIFLNYECSQTFY